MTTRRSLDEDEVGKRLLAIFQEVLQVDGAGLDDRIPDLAGNSMSIIKVAVAIEAEFGSEVPLEMFLQTPSARQVAAAVIGAGPSKVTR
ncbi:phosphopantetheine-binding protein [Streptomyces noursei]|uniref:phosphopantetheine-binding protein n=1 Tax=Streptomyces noursei TaxID=1971 RepID=UPI00196434ED|nr:phosphopantetheine-binding protein [Streptomyces noursei]QRX96536.1 acyl carrier protein [Streptomyces noursei]